VRVRRRGAARRPFARGPRRRRCDSAGSCQLVNELPNGAHRGGARRRSNQRRRVDGQ
jgi:hypothetical protein